MKKLFYFILMLLAGFVFAQNVTYLGHTTFSKKGSGAAGTPSNQVWDIPAGQNRVMIVTMWFEREHRPAPLSDNYPSGSNGSNQIPPTVGGISMTNNTLLRSWYNSDGTNSVASSEFGTVMYRYTLSDAQGLPTGNTTISFPGVQQPKSDGDEVIIAIEVFGNVSPATPFTDNRNVYDNVAGTTASSSFSVTAPSVTPPAGRTASDIMYLGWYLSTAVDLSGVSGGSWTGLNAYTSGNPLGSGWTASISDRPVNEPDGINVQTAYTIGGTPTYTINRSTSDRIHEARIGIMALLPLAKPAVEGYVLDDTGTTAAHINGQVARKTNGGGLYVNAVDSNGLVVASVQVGVADTGKFVIPAGVMTEGEAYELQLSRYPGTVGEAPLPIELNSPWNIVGESQSGSAAGTAPVDGTADGIIVIAALPAGGYTAAASTTSTLRFGIGTPASLAADGRVWHDVDGLPNIGGGTNPTTIPGALPLYVNAVDENGIVRGVATVANNGTWSIAAGTTGTGLGLGLYDTHTYDFQVSKNQGTVGDEAPAKELNAGWTTVGEADAATGNDGEPDGIFTWTFAGANKTNIRFGIILCNAGDTAPVIN